MVSNSRRKKKGSDIVDTSDKSSTSPSSLRDIFNYESPPIQKISHEDSFMARKVSSNTKKQKDVIKTSTSQDPSMIPKDQHLNTECQDIPRNLPIPYIQLPVGEVNKLDDLTVNTRKNIRRTYGKKNQDATRNEQLVLHSPDTAIHISPAQLSTKTVEKQPEAPHNKSQQQSTKIRKKSILSELSKGGSNVPSTSISGSKGGSNVPLVSISGSKDFSNSSSSSSKSRITDFPSSSQLTGMTSIKRKNPEESGSNELLTKHVKLNANIKSILEKVLEEQLKQRITIDNLQKSNEKLSHEIFENHKLLQNIFTILTSESTIMNEKTQRGGPKQRLKRKDTKHMWWDTPMTKACHQLFQVNKNPSDADVEQAFRSQVQADFPQKMQELVNSNEWTNLWKAVHSIMLEYFRNHRSFYVRKIKDAIYSLLTLFSYKLNQFAGPKEVMQWKRSERVKKARCNIWKKIDDNDPNSPCTIEAILQRAFTKEELQNKNNIKFGVTVALMFLDPTYDQVEILSSKVQERMDQWDSNPIIQRWLEGKELLEDDMTDYVDDNELSMHFDKDVTMDDDNEPSIHFDQESDSDNDVENGVYNNEDAEKTDSEDSD